jgi:hypothetical protein
MKDIKEIKDYANLAFEILQNETDYFRNKNIISKMFKISDEKRFDIIFLRLTIIDSCYSTNMKNRFCGIEDLAEKINTITNDDNSLIKICADFISNPTQENKLNDLFNGIYGINKKGFVYGKAISLISKYLYFLTNYKFPINDNLVNKSIKLLEHNYKLKFPKSKHKHPITFFEKIIYLNTISQINEVDKLDNFLWLIGKLKFGSFALILNKEKYQELTEKVGIPNDTKSNKIDEEIRNYIITNIDIKNEIFEEKEIKFLKYSLTKITVPEKNQKPNKTN